MSIIIIINAIRNKTLDSVNLSLRKVKPPKARKALYGALSNIRIFLVTFKIGALYFVRFIGAVFRQPLTHQVSFPFKRMKA